MGKVSSKDHRSGLKRINFRFRYGHGTVLDYGTVKQFERFCLIDRRLSTDSSVHYCNTVFRLLAHANKPLRAITKDDVRDFLALFSNNHTYRNNLKGMRVFFRDFMKKPELVDSFRFPRAEVQPKFLPTKGQLSEFYNALEGDHERVLFMLYACVGPISNCIEGITITVDLTVSNPGFIPITLEKVTYSLFICGEFVGQGNTGPISIPAGSSSTVRVTQTISKSSIPNALWQVFANKGLAEISASGQAKVLFLDVPFTYTTQVDVYQKIRDGIMAAIQG